ncbi:hypothetical protein Ocin01_17565 [Orchesella cincta]|uniref:Uncharacterized protein n=1 Tax=Orchesella cincta TaxID=48709 RepID=A0A1D2M852_ORCCI|nr:hypothetical protein Ocin01_17565 [Orchesella cincta]
MSSLEIQIMMVGTKVESHSGKLKRCCFPLQLNPTEYPSENTTLRVLKWSNTEQIEVEPPNALNPPRERFLSSRRIGSPVRIRSTLLLSYSSLISELYEQDASTIYLDFADEETLTQVVQLLHGFTVVFKHMDRVQMIKDVFHNLAIPFSQDSFHVFPYETLTRESELDITVEYETVGDDDTQISGEIRFPLEVHDQDNGKHENEETHGTENESTVRLKHGEPEEIEPTSMDSPAESRAEDSQEPSDERHDPETNKSEEPPATKKPELSESRVTRDDEPAQSMIITSMSVLSRAEYMSQGQSPTIYNDSEFRAMLSEGKIKFNPLEHQLITQRYSTGMPVLVREKSPVPNSGLSSLPVLEKQAPNTKFPRPNNPRKRMRKYEKMELYVGSKVGKEKALSEMVPFVHFYVEDDVDASGAQSSTNGSNQTQQHITNAGAASTGPDHGSSVAPPQNNVDTHGPEDPELTSQRPKKRKRLTPKTAQTTTELPPCQKTSTDRLIEATATGISGQPPNPSQPRSEATKLRTKKQKRLTDATTVASTTTQKSRIHPSNEPELALAQPEIQFKQTEREVPKKTPKRPPTKEPTPPVSSTADTPIWKPQHHD